MKPVTRRMTGLALLAILLIGCAGAAPPPSPTPPPTPPGGGYLLRLTMLQAIPPEHRFGWLPHVAITDDRVLLTVGAVPAIYPGPLLPVWFGRQMTDAGYARIVAEARRLGMLQGNGDFAPGGVAPGAALGRIEIVVDGVWHDLRGDPGRLIVCITTPCEPPAGTPEAFATFWQILSDLPSLLGPELGPEAEYIPEALAILIATPVRGDGGVVSRLAAWPLAASLRDLGVRIGGDALPRCATVLGSDVAPLLAAFGQADQLTNWVDPDGDAADAVFLHVRPLLPGEDVCAELQGIG